MSSNVEINSKEETQKRIDHLNSKIFALQDKFSSESFIENIKNNILNILGLGYKFNKDKYIDENSLDIYIKKIDEILISVSGFNFEDDFKLLKYSVKIRKIYSIFKLFDNKLPFLKEILNESKEIEKFARLNIKNYSDNIEVKETNQIFESQFDELKIGKRKDIIHPKNDLEENIGGFIKNLYLDKDIDEVVLSIYGLESDYESNSILRELILLAKIKRVTVVLEPKASGVNKNAIKYIKNNGIDVIIPERRVHGKFILGINKNKNKSKYFVSSGNFITEQLPDNETEDFSCYGKSKLNKGIGKEVSLIVSYLKGETEYSDLTKSKFNKLIVSPFITSKLIEKIKNEKEEIYIASTTFYDPRIYDALCEATNRGVKVIVSSRTGLIHLNKKGNKINIIKREESEIGESKHHGRIFYFKGLNEAYVGSLGCNGNNHKGIDILYKKQIDDDFIDLLDYQLEKSKLINI